MTATAMRKWAIPAGALALALAMTGCASGSGTQGSSNKTLTVDTSFVVKSLDPGMVYEATGNIAVHALYDTLVTFDGSDVSTVKPSLASSFEQTDDAKTFTFTLRKGVTFADGKKLTSDDVVFSLNRLINLQGSASQTVQGLHVAADGDDKVVFTSETPDPQVFTKLAMPAASIIDATAAKKLGASDDENAAKDDKVGNQLDTASLGTGPYTLKSYDASSKIVLTANPKYWGDKPAYDRVVLQNVDVQNQKLTIQKSTGDEIALDLTGNQAKGLSSKLQVSGVADTSYFLSLNQDPAVSAITSNPAFVAALRQTVDGQGIADLFGKGATAAAGLVPPAYAGALPESDAPKQDIDGAKKALAAAGITAPKVKLVYPAITYHGVDLGTVVTKVQQDAKKAGIDIELTPQPINVFLENQSAGKSEISFSPNSLNYPASSSLVNNMAPGKSTALRTGWTEDRANPAVIVAGGAVNAATTAKAQNDAMIPWQKAMNQYGPFIALANDAGIVVATSNLKGAVYTPAGWIVDVADVSSK
ncbi:ABC transporter substrate-binding protein [Leifsonia poae]|uniref:ABC transporter substrate-binding protein n=1 Tax=Leifsonia poae TaxID=110933 RepID=UPI001CBF88FD|nr:ABC transporter substrate-binding protein [Leifsonia poae]